MGEAKKRERTARELEEERIRNRKKRILWLKRTPKAFLAALLCPIWLPIAIFIAVLDDGRLPWES